MTSSQPVPAGERRIVVGVDGSPESENALRWAAQLSRWTGAGIDALVAWQYPPYGWTTPDWDPAKDAGQALADTVDAAFGDEPPADVNLVTREGHAAQVLIDSSKTALVLLVGSRGRGGFAQALLGSVSSKCAEHASCPVLIVRGELPL